jgi:hypothetical protein
MSSSGSVAKSGIGSDSIANSGSVAKSNSDSDCMAKSNSAKSNRTNVTKRDCVAKSNSANSANSSSPIDMDADHSKELQQLRIENEGLRAQIKGLEAKHPKKGRHKKKVVIAKSPKIIEYYFVTNPKNLKINDEPSKSSTHFDIDLEKKNMRIILYDKTTASINSFFMDIAAFKMMYDDIASMQVGETYNLRKDALSKTTDVVSRVDTSDNDSSEVS